MQPFRELVEREIDAPAHAELQVGAIRALAPVEIFEGERFLERSAGPHDGGIAPGNLDTGLIRYADQRIAIHRPQLGPARVISGEQFGDRRAARQPLDQNLVRGHRAVKSEEHTSELQSLMRNSYALFCLKKK